jgi:RNA polymerase sigma-70 factor (ECF subfamily)
MNPRENETELGGPRGSFPTTAWTSILQSRDPGSPAHQDALDRLIRAYWKPVYFFIRRRGESPESSKDLTQSFFGHLIEKSCMESVDREKGRFRHFMLAVLKNFLSDEHDRSRARKRGGHLNFVQAEGDLASVDLNPEEAFFRQWALDLMAAAMERLQLQCPAEDLALLRGAASPGMAPHERKNRLHRVREKLKELLRQEIRATVDRESEIDEELSALFSSLYPK